MKWYLRLIFFVLLAICYKEAAAQLEWAVSPIVEEATFFYLPNSTKDFLIVGEKAAGQRLQRMDGSYAFHGQKLWRLQVVGASGIWTGMINETEPIVFNREEKVLSENYDDLNNQYRTNVLMTKKGDLFGLLDASGKVIRKPKYQNLKRKARGHYVGELPSGVLEDILVEETDGLTDAVRATNLRINSSQLQDRIVFQQESGKRNYSFWGFSDMEGKVILPADRYYSNYRKMHFDEQVMVAIDSKTDKEGVLDKDGQVIVPFMYDQVNPSLVNGQYVVGQIADTFAVIGLNGVIRSKLSAGAVYPLGKVPYLFKKEGDQVLLVDLDLQPVLPDTFSYINYQTADNAWFLLKKGNKVGFYAYGSGVYTPPRFEKAVGPYRLDTVIVQDNGLFGLFDVPAGKMVLLPGYHKLERTGHFFLGTSFRQDSVAAGEDKYVPTKVKQYSVMNRAGSTILGPTDQLLRWASGSIFVEEIRKDSLVLHDLMTHRKVVFSKQLPKVSGEITQLSKTDYVFTEDLLQEEAPTHYQYLGKKDKTGLRVYLQSGKYGLMVGRRAVTGPEYDELNLKATDYGIKARVGDYWGVLTLPEGLDKD